MSQRDEKEVETILAREKKALVRLANKRSANTKRMHKIREENDKIDLLIEKLTGEKVEKAKVVIKKEDAR